MKTTLLPVFLMLFLLFISSCDAVYNYEYRITNSADSAINVHLIGMTNHFDTSFVVAPGSIQKIFSTSHGVEGPHGPHFKSVHNDIDSLTIRKNGRLTPKNFVADDSWQFSKSGGVGVYNTGVSMSDF